MECEARSDRIPLRDLEKVVREFRKKSKKKRKPKQCKCCVRLRKELAPILEALTNAVLMSDFMVDQARVDEGRLAVEEWMASQIGAP